MNVDKSVKKRSLTYLSEKLYYVGYVYSIINFWDVLCFNCHGNSFSDLFFIIGPIVNMHKAISFVLHSKVSQAIIFSTAK